MPYLILPHIIKNIGGSVSLKISRKQLMEKSFFVNIDTKFNKKGSLDLIGEIYIRGKTTKEILLSANICHPSLANNELSGPTLLAYLAKYLNKKKTNYSYRILFLPETMGPITYLSKKLKLIQKKLYSWFTLSCIGDPGKFSMIQTPNADSYSDKIAMELIKKYKKKRIYKFTDCGSDERQFNYPGINLPVVTLTRSKFGKFKEYHTSNDNLKFINSKSLGDSYKFVKSIIDKIESNYNKNFRIYATTKCEPFFKQKKFIQIYIRYLKTFEN